MNCAMPMLDGACARVVHRSGGCQHLWRDSRAIVGFQYLLAQPPPVNSEFRITFRRDRRAIIIGQEPPRRPPYGRWNRSKVGCYVGDIPKMADVAPLNVVFLAGADSRSTRLAIESVCSLAHVRPVAILLDTARPGLTARFRNLRRNIRREGYGYIFQRLLKPIQRLTDGMVERATPGEPAEILRRAFPDRCFSFADISHKYGLQVHRVENLNGAAAVAALSALRADLGIVIGTRILKRSTFALPRLGSINLHKGAVPRYRGMPPGFWEIYNGEESAGVTVHFVDDKLDTGPVAASSQVEISPLDTPDSLIEKLHLLGAQVLRSAVSDIQSGAARPVAQERSELKPYSRPTRRQVAELRSRLPHWRNNSAAHGILKNLFVLAIYYSGLYRFVKWRHELWGTLKTGQ